MPARELFILCRALRVCDGVEIRRCTPVVRPGIARMRVDIALRAGSAAIVLRRVLRHMRDAAPGRIRSAGVS